MMASPIGLVFPVTYLGIAYRGLYFFVVIDSLIPTCYNTLAIKYMYADDASIVHFIRMMCYDDNYNLQYDWDSLVKWSSLIRLPLNYDKCCVMNPKWLYIFYRFLSTVLSGLLAPFV